MDILDFFWTFYLNHLSPLWGYFFPTTSLKSLRAARIDQLADSNKPAISPLYAPYVPLCAPCAPLMHPLHALMHPLRTP